MQEEPCIQGQGIIARSQSRNSDSVWSAD